MPFAKAGDLSAIGIRDTVVMEPNDLFTIVNNEDRLLDHHTAWGQGASTMHRERRAFASVDSVVVIERVRGDSIIVTVYQTYYSSQLESTDQLLLVDNNGRVVDVVRYGNYTYPGPGTDPYPSNQSIGIIPEFQSIARYAGGYFTGNTANDFYITNA
ncbi:MAG TPA: hypothetical protein DGH68_06500, partial [Bacteroidetes bacterium]|nr:hypothetical protein [Bacteroidota bacterium]